MEDPEQTKYSFKLDVVKIIIDKLLIGLIIVAAGFLANKYIEDYRSKLTVQKFLMDKKLEAIQSISESYSYLFSTFDKYSLENNGNKLPDNYNEQYEQSADKLIEASNRWAPLLSDDYNKQIEYYIWILTAFKDVSKAKPYRDFISDLDQKFKLMCAREIRSEKLSTNEDFSFNNWTRNDIESKGVEVFFTENFNKWKQWKHNEKVN